MRAPTGVTGGPSEYAGRWLECNSNVVPRGMIASQLAGLQNPAYRSVPHLNLLNLSPNS